MDTPMSSAIPALWMLYFVLVGAVICYGHRRAVEKSEANLRAKFDADPNSAGARKLMREAGYNV